MATSYEDPGLALQALAYVIEVFEELKVENGAPPLGSQNQAVDFILADPRLRESVVRWAVTAETGEAAPPHRPPQDAAYCRIRDFLQRVIDRPAFAERGSPT